MSEVPSASRANKAGDRLRRYRQGRLDPGVDIGTERAVLAAWRKQFQVPTSSTTTTLRSAIATVLGQYDSNMAVERLKRESQILAKLHRQQTRLSKMEDIGGCRAVLPTLADVYAVAERIRKHARAVDVIGEDDYNESPRPGGYRALHLHAMRAGVPVEIQLRTRRQNGWADTVEEWDAASGHDVKHEFAPPEVIRAFRIMADAAGELDRSDGAHLWATLAGRQGVALLRNYVIGQEV